MGTGMRALTFRFILKCFGSRFNRKDQSDKRLKQLKLPNLNKPKRPLRHFDSRFGILARALKFLAHALKFQIALRRFSSSFDVLARSLHFSSCFDVLVRTLHFGSRFDVLALALMFRLAL